jgi:pilus assembly protein CpaB
MSAVRIAILAIAAIAAIALAFVVRGMMSPKAPPAQVAAAAPAKPMAQVLVAKRDLPVGTRLTPTDLTWQAWPVDGLNPNFVTDGAVPAPVAKGSAEKVAQKAAKVTTDLVMSGGPMQAFDGAIVKEALLAGEPVVARKVVRGGQGGYMAVVLTPGMRAVSVPISVETAAGGFILPGDRVDVLQSRAGAAEKSFITETLMRNLRVLAIDQHSEPAKDSNSIVGAVAVLEVPSADVEVLVRGKAQGEMQLALRSYSDIAGGAARGGTARQGAGLRIFRGGGEPQEVVVR